MPEWLAGCLFGRRSGKLAEHSLKPRSANLSECSFGRQSGSLFGRLSERSVGRMSGRWLVYLSAKPYGLMLASSERPFEHYLRYCRRWPRLYRYLSGTGMSGQPRKLPPLEIVSFAKPSWQR